jgi:hypothetical protein
MILVGAAALGLFYWLFFVPPKRPMTAEDLARAEETRLIGFLVGAMGGDIQQAAVARYALQRFKEQHGRKATMEDMGLLLGLVKVLG